MKSDWGVSMSFIAGGCLEDSCPRRSARPVTANTRGQIMNLAHRRPFAILYGPGTTYDPAERCGRNRSWAQPGMSSVMRDSDVDHKLFLRDEARSGYDARRKSSATAPTRRDAAPGAPRKSTRFTIDLVA